MEIHPYLANNWDQLTEGLGEIRNTFFQELMRAYSAPNRHYHNLTHIKQLLTFVDTYQDQLTLPNQVRWAIWYHDAVYNPFRKDNEDKSAVLAQKRLQELGLSQESYSQIGSWILATKTHSLDVDNQSLDGWFLLDIDLSILAAERSTYETYCVQIRKEYSMYPKVLYNRGRKKVLQHFLELASIYKTDFFQQQWEKKAKENLGWELGRL